MACQKFKVEGRRVIRCAAGMGLQVEMTAHFSSLMSLSAHHVQTVPYFVTGTV